MLVAKTGIKYKKVRYPKGYEFKKDEIDAKTVAALIADGAIEDISKKKK